MNDELVNQGWKQMELLLDERMPVNRKRRYAGYYWLAGIATLLLALSAIYLLSDRSETISATSSSVNDNKGAVELTKNNLTPQITKKSGSTSISSEAARSNSNTNSKNKSNSSSNSTSSTISDPDSEASSTNTASTELISADRDKKEVATINKKSTNQIHNAQVKNPNLNVVFNVEKNALKTTANTSSFKPAAYETKKNQNVTSSSINQQQAVVSNLANNKADQSKKTRPSATFNEVDRMELLGLDQIQHQANQLNHIALNTLAIEPRTRTSRQNFRWQLYIDGLIGNGMKGTNLGISMMHRLANKFSVSTGIELAYYTFDEFNRGDNTMAPSSEIFENATSYSSYLADNSVYSSEFISTVTTIFAPINMLYALCDKIDFAVGIRPGIQLSQNLSYAPIANENINRNPVLENGSLTAKDFFHQKSVATIQTSFGINYHISPKLLVGTFYRPSLSDYGRSVQYSSSDRLNQIGAEDVDRGFYSIGTKKLSSNLFGVRLGYKF